jgi:hypothetical protein
MFALGPFVNFPALETVQSVMQSESLNAMIKAPRSNSQGGRRSHHPTQQSGSLGPFKCVRIEVNTF